jgi:Uma2 family endonuclease
MDVVTTLPRGRPLTRDDLESMPDDGHRYELIDGSLIVTPAPSVDHQRVLAALYLLLHAACPPDHEVLFAPVDVALAEDTVMQPDLLVARRRDLTQRDLPRAPVLAVEVLSPSTQRIDRTLKKSRLEAAGCECYWVVDPRALTLTAWQLRGSVYVEVASVAGDEEYAAERPFPVRVRPADLLAR